MPILVDAGDDNPFHVKLVPTDEQPDFADSLQGNFGTASQQLLNQEAQRRGVVGNVLQHFTLPGRIAQGVQNLPGEDPNVMTEEKAFRLNQQNNEALDWAHGQALNTIGTGMPMAEKMALGTGGGGAKVYYHGSPHDFDKFDVGKIGTGEGNQVYGHGLYFTERPEIAKQYRDALSEVAVGGRAYDSNDPIHLATALVADKGKEGALADLRARSTYDRSDFFKMAVNYIESGQPLPTFEQKGRMYEVNINADPEHFLNWDKPLSEQPHALQALKNLQEHEAPFIRDRAVHYGTNQELRGEQVAGDIPTEQLREAGIPGIKYLDQGSRNTNQFRVSTEYHPEADRYHVFDQNNKTHGTFDTKEAANAFAEQKNTEGQTHNYVVFHHDIVDILKKYGLAGLVGAGAAHFKTTPVDNNPFTAQQ